MPTKWFAEITKLLSDAGCKSTKVNNIHTGDGTEYYHGKTKIKVCKLVTGENGQSIVMHGNHFTMPYSIVDELPENMLQVLKTSAVAAPAQTREPAQWQETATGITNLHSTEKHTIAAAAVFGSTSPRMPPSYRCSKSGSNPNFNGT